MKKLVSVQDLEMGMILDEDIIEEQTGVILIARNMAITKQFIQNLISKEIDKVSIRKEEIPKEKYNQPLVDNYSKVGEKLDNLFIKVKNGRKVAASGIVNDMKGFVREIVGERDILTQMRLLKKKDDYTFNHSLGVSILAASLGKWLNYSLEEIEDLAIAGLFHDIGKLRISDNIINKSGNLTEEEFEIMKKHSFYSFEMLSAGGKFNDDILLGVLQHHEKMNATGYPNGVSGDRIHRYARIISICDIYHALTSRRVYRDRESPLKVADYIRSESFSTLDPYITQVFLKNISKFYVGNKVVLNTGEIGIIVYIHPQDKTKPIVQVANKFIDLLRNHDIEVADIII